MPDWTCLFDLRFVNINFPTRNPNMSTVRKLGDYLKVAGINVEPQEEPAKKEAAAPEQPKQAAPATSQKDEAPAGGHKPQDKQHEAPAGDTGEQIADKVTKSAQQEGKIAAGTVQYDPALIKTAAQKWCLEELGALIPNEKTAQALYDEAVNRAKTAQAQEEAKLAAQLEAQGAAIYRGQVKESAAFQLANGDLSIADVCKVAAQVGCDVNEIVHKARELKLAADGAAAAVTNDTFFSGALGTAARTGSSNTQQAAERNNNTTEYQVDAQAGTRPEQNGPNEKDMRFVDTATLPGNPGLNHGQSVDQGKGL
jgi:hypothetical protein